jgi:hypothetical protein
VKFQLDQNIDPFFITYVGSTVLISHLGIEGDYMLTKHSNIRRKPSFLDDHRVDDVKLIKIEVLSISRASRSLDNATALYRLHHSMALIVEAWFEIRDIYEEPGFFHTCVLWRRCK